MEKSEIMKPKGARMEADIEKFALALRTWRIRQGLTQRQAAAQMGVSRDSILRAENQRAVSWETMYRIFIHLSENIV